MKIVYVLEVFPVISETFILQEILEVQKKGIDVVVFSMKKREQKVVHDDFRNIKSLCYFAPVNFTRHIFAHLFVMATNFTGYLKALRYSFNSEMGVRKFFLLNLPHILQIKKEEPTCIHTHFGWRGADMAMLIHLLYKVPFTFTSHHSDILRNPPRNYKVKSCLARKHVTISAFNKKYLIDHFSIPVEQLEVVHCGVSPLVSQKNNKPEEIKVFRILTVARLSSEKNLITLLEVYRKLKEQGMLFKAQIIGEGSERKSLEDFIESNNLTDAVSLLGAKTQDEVFQALDESSVFVLPSTSEGIPVSIMEAMLLRVPVVATRIMGIPELVEDGVSGYLVEPYDVDVFVDRIFRLYGDSELRLRLAEAAYQKICIDFNREREVSKLVAIWSADRDVV